MRERSTVRRRVLFAFVLMCIAPCSARLGGAEPQARGLSLVQIEKLIQIHSPDDVVAQEIRSRGLDFAPTSKILDGLQKRGAGQATLAAIRERIPVGTLEVQAPPGSNVAVDGADLGATDSQGRLVLADLPAGAHRLVVSKTGYRLGDFNLLLAAREYKRFSAPLDWAGGYLTVRTDQPTSVVDIGGLGKFNNGVSDLQCSPGTYDVTVMSPGMKTEKQSVSVAAAQHAVVEVHLTPDPEYIRNGLAEASQRFSRGDAQGSIQIGTSLLALEPNNPEIQGLLAEAYWRVRDLEHFESAAASAVRGGRMVLVDLAHEHLVLAGEAIHPASLAIAAKTVAYDPGTESCKYHAFGVPSANVEMIEVTNKTASGFMVVRHLMQGTYLLHLDFRDPTKSEKKATLYFAMPDSRIARQSNNVNYLMSQGDSEQALNAVANLIRVAKSAADRQ